MRMAIDSGEHNQTRGRALSVIIMQHLQPLTATSGEVSMWNLTKAIAVKYGFKGTERDKLYGRIRTTLQDLEGAGLITTEKRWDRELRTPIRYIRPCSAN